MRSASVGRPEELQDDSTRQPSRAARHARSRSTRSRADRGRVAPAGHAAADPPRTGGRRPTRSWNRARRRRVLALPAAAASPRRRRTSRGTSRRSRQEARREARPKKRLSRGLRAVQIANRLTGIPYVWGGASPRSGFDCSGLVQYMYGKLGIPLPHYTVSQYGLGRPVSRSSLRPGDLVFFYGLNHVGSTPAAASTSMRPGAARPCAGHRSRRIRATTAHAASSPPEASLGARARCSG